MRESSPGATARPLRRAAIVAIGSEMLGPFRQDTNSLWLTARLEEIGIEVVSKAIVGDEVSVIVRELDRAAESAELVLTTGGLGPTADDRTVEALARWLGTPLERNAEFVAEIRARFARRGISMPAVNEKQADFPVGARVLANSRGTAPGFWGRRGEVEIVVLPGVPSEMREIMEESVLPELSARGGGLVTRRRVLRMAGAGESAIEEMVSPLYAKWPDNPVTILAAPGEVQLHLTAIGTPERAAARLAEMERDFRAALGPRIFGADQTSLAEAVGLALRERGASFALAESCTGGLVAELVTAVPGASDYFLGGLVAYSNRAKSELLGVSEETLRRHGAVSEETAREMARGARERFGATIAASLTGIAGPGGGSEEKPVGTVYIAVAEDIGRETCKRRLFGGDREVVRRASAIHALELVRRHLAEPGP